MIKICPHCNMRFVIEDVEDFVHECNSRNKVFDEEDVLKIGDWEDYTGSGIVNNVLMQGKENKVWGTRADIEGEVVHNVTRRGKRASTHRQRQHEEWIKLNKIERR